MEGSGILEAVILHEMGHVLGFGTLWEFGRDLRDGTGSPDPRFTGPLAIATYAELGGSGTVPIEGDFGPGTQGSHWDEDTFYNELMTGFLNSGARTNPLSDLSIAAMGDLGYVVNLGTGERYKLPPSQGPDLAVTALGTGRPELDLARREILIKPSAVAR